MPNEPELAGGAANCPQCDNPLHNGGCVALSPDMEAARFAIEKRRTETQNAAIKRKIDADWEARIRADEREKCAKELEQVADHSGRGMGADLRWAARNLRARSWNPMWLG